MIPQDSGEVILAPRTPYPWTDLVEIWHPSHSTSQMRWPPQRVYGGEMGAVLSTPIYFLFFISRTHAQLTLRSVDFCSVDQRICFRGKYVPIESFCLGANFPFLPQNPFYMDRS